MKETSNFRTSFTEDLGAYLRRTDETALARAYDLGRRALAEKLGLLELVTLQHQALGRILARAEVDPATLGRIRAAQAFFIESLSPYEMTHRAFEDANAALYRINETLEAEVKRIAHLLHDEAGQLLVAVHIALDEISRDARPDVQRRCRNTRDILDQIERHLRDVSHELHPTVLDDLGLIPAFEFLAKGMSMRAGLRVAVEGAAGERLPPAIETALYHIVVEALTNVARHARASRATIRLERDASKVHCVVKDDGAGFDVKAVLSRRGQRGLGLAGIRERLKPLMGSVEISSAPARGTELSIEIPLRS
jgi:signal transduction histidine kinase